MFSDDRYALLTDGSIYLPRLGVKLRRNPNEYCLEEFVSHKDIKAYVCVHHSMSNSVVYAQECKGRLILFKNGMSVVGLLTHQSLCWCTKRSRLESEVITGQPLFDWWHWWETLYTKRVLDFWYKRISLAGQDCTRCVCHGGFLPMPSGDSSRPLGCWRPEDRSRQEHLMPISFPGVRIHRSHPGPGVGQHPYLWWQILPLFRNGYMNNFKNAWQLTTR